MKRRILIAALALVLALGTLISVNSTVAATALPVEIETISSIGDPAAARGLTLDYRLCLRNNLRWYSKYDCATGENETDFYLTYRQEDLPAYLQNWSADQRTWQIVSTPGSWYTQNDPVVDAMLAKAKRAAGENYNGRYWVEDRIYLGDYYDYYPLRLSTWGYYYDNSDLYFDRYYYSGAISTNDEGDYVDLPFDKLRIPTTPNDFFELGYEFQLDGHQNNSRGSSSSVSNCFVENQFIPYSVRNGDSLLVTVGFPAGVQPQADWAPEGFGIWAMPIRRQELSYQNPSLRSMQDDFPVTEECRLVYPLDIETQRVMLLRQSRDGAYLLLATVENDRYVLRVLDSEDYTLVGETDLGGATVCEELYSKLTSDVTGLGTYRENEASAQCRYVHGDETESGVDELWLTGLYYPGVTMRQGENFIAVMMDDRLAVLTPSEKGYDLQFICDTAWHGTFMWSTDGETWNYDKKYDWFIGGGAANAPEDAYGFDWRNGYDTVGEDFAMAYNGTYLASAVYADDDVVLSIYGPDGLAYGVRLRNSVLNQDGGGSISSRPVCQDVLETSDDYYDPKPGLSWE